ncbi:hypothetical protein AAHA92_24984 [Salvia divinorum]|uniref:Ribosomal protein L22 n=1 Tax=Salvia divinorum TaxID=28513 RepID=A0ABD1G970_SALDI
MGNLIRLKTEKRLKSIRREMVKPIYDKKNAAKIAIQEAALAAPKPPLNPLAPATCLRLFHHHGSRDCY